MKVDQASLIYGRNPVKEALRSGQIKTVYLTSGFHDQKFLDELKENGIKPIIVSNQEMDASCPGVHQGVAAEIKKYNYSSLEEIITSGKGKKNSIIVMLDGINDPHNLGAIIRSCDVFGVDGIIVSKHNQVSLTATVAKSSAGAISYMKVAQVNNLNNAINTLKENGYWILSTDGMAKQDYNTITYDFPVVVIIGSEGYGVSQLLLKNSDYIVKIPMYGHVNSLNASVAAGILLSRIRG